MVNDGKRTTRIEWIELQSDGDNGSPASIDAEAGAEDLVAQRRTPA